jgi:hypothetical protein
MKVQIRKLKTRYCYQCEASVKPPNYWRVVCKGETRARLICDRCATERLFLLFRPAILQGKVRVTDVGLLGPHKDLFIRCDFGFLYPWDRKYWKQKLEVKIAQCVEAVPGVEQAGLWEE